MLFHPMWNNSKNGTTDLLRQLNRRLPADWRTRASREPKLRRRGRESTPDVVITIEAPDKTRAVLLVEAKNRLEPLEVEKVLQQVRSYGSGVPFIYAPYLSPRTRERIADLG